MNKLRVTITLITILMLFVISKGESYAFQNHTIASAKLKSEVNTIPFDNRAEILEGYLKQYDSPLAPYAKDFIKYADMYDLDWKLVASIAGLESTFGKHIPYNSYNGWGWGVYGDNVIRFQSWSEGIETISKGLRERYLDEGQYSDPYVIGPTYAASPTWAQRVTYFMNRIEEYRLRNGKSSLTLTI